MDQTIGQEHPTQPIVGEYYKIVFIKISTSGGRLRSSSVGEAVASVMERLKDSSYMQGCTWEQSETVDAAIYRVDGDAEERGTLVAVVEFQDGACTVTTSEPIPPSRPLHDPFAPLDPTKY